MTETPILPKTTTEPATFVGRVWRPGIGPALVWVDQSEVFDITSKAFPTMAALLAADDPLAVAQDSSGERFATLDDLCRGSVPDATDDDLRWLAPCDLQAIKACGVTFADSMVERVIEEQAAGDPKRAEAIRAKVRDIIGESLAGLVPGSAEAAEVKRIVQAEGLWSQYLEVGIGPDAEVFTKAQPMSAVGWGAAVGLHPVSSWNNPEPEIVLAVSPAGRIVGATLGNDVNLRDVEGRSALLLGKAKDNNASCSIGPVIRLFDVDFTLDHVRHAELTMTVTGTDGFEMSGASSMSQISRDPADLVAQTIGAHHQYPDGLMLFCGTMFAPVQDRAAPGQGFTHHAEDLVQITEPSLGTLSNIVRLSPDCPPWDFGTGAMMRNLAGRGLI